MRSLKRIAYVGGSWSSNIGNAFYNLGSDALLRSLGGAEIFFAPDPPDWKAPAPASFDLIGSLDVDLVILTGPCLNLRLQPIFERSFKKLKKRGVKLGFISAGMSIYDEGEAREVKKFFEKYPIEFLFTRDSETYKYFRSMRGTFIFDGLCTSMFLNEAVAPMQIDQRGSYYVFNFDGKKQPVIEKIEPDEFSVTIPRFRRIVQRKLDGLPIIRTNNMDMATGYRDIYRNPDTYHSDLPNGYLPILAGAKAVFSERVHTCAATLILGGVAQYISISTRSLEHRKLLFNRIGASEVMKKPTSLDMVFIEKEKRLMRDALQRVISAI